MNLFSETRGGKIARSLAALLLLSCLLCPAAASAFEPAGSKAELYRRAQENLLRMKTEAAEEIRRLEREIAKCDQTAARAGEIIQQARAQGKSQAEQVGQQARTRALEAKKRNESALAAARTKEKRVAEAFRTVTSLLAKETSDQPVAKVDCAALLKDRLNDPARKASEDCECYDPERPPVCAAKGEKLPAKPEGVYWFGSSAEVMDLTGSSMQVEDIYMGTHKSLSEAQKACVEAARIKALSRGQHVQGEVDCLLWSSPR